MISLDDVKKSFKTFNLSLTGILTVSIATMSLAVIGSVLLFKKGGNLFSRLGILYFGGFLFGLVAFFAALNGYIS
ncbi:hypothetical protein ACOMCU_00595 [Lysinibacillus sp. UGB7]|uniref:hypothetical protein n=1 Tax=Lysinibacillus sp. UGB7 TaxID=3411039 RepID=UPI003B7842ED